MDAGIMLNSMELAIIKERKTFMQTPSGKIQLRAIDWRGVMVGRAFDKGCESAAMEMAKKYWLKRFMYVEVFS